MKNKKILAVLLVITAIGVLAGCGNSEEAAEAEKVETAEATEDAQNSEVTTIRVANAAMPKPYSYLGDDGEVTGYDIDVIKAVFDYLPEYEMELTVTEFPSILAGLDSGRYDVGINCLKYTEERAEKYIFSDPYLDDFSVVIVPEDNTDINSLADLNGKYDFMYLNRLTYEQYNEEFHYQHRSFELIDEEKALYNNGVDTELTYIMVSKTEEGQKLVDRVNEALAALKEDGTLDGFAEKYFGSTEYVPD